MNLYYERLQHPTWKELSHFAQRRGRSGGLETLVETINLIADGEAAGFDVETEVKVEGGPIRAPNGQVKVRSLDVAYYRDGKFVRGFQLVKNIEDWVSPRIDDREPLRQKLEKRFHGRPVEIICTGIQRRRM